MIRVALLDDYQGVALDYAEWSRLAGRAEVVTFRDHLTNEDALADRLREFDVVMALRERTPFWRSLLTRLPRLKLLTTAGMRNASIDVAAATEFGILVCGTGGSGSGTPELTWGLIHAILRQIPREHAATRAGRWQETVGVDLRGKTLGLAGLGNIGGAVARVGAAFGMNLIAWSQNLTPERAKECGASLVSKQELLTGSDILTIHLVLSERTRGLFGANDLALMKPASYLINTSRGPIVDEQALVDVLQRRAIAGAALDVFDQEPLPAGHPLLALDNVVLTPHLGYVTEEAYHHFYSQTLQNIEALLDGAPTRVLNPDVLPNHRPLT